MPNAEADDLVGCDGSRIEHTMTNTGCYSCLMVRMGGSIDLKDEPAKIMRTEVLSVDEGHAPSRDWSFHTARPGCHRMRHRTPGFDRESRD